MKSMLQDRRTFIRKFMLLIFGLAGMTLPQTWCRNDNQFKLHTHLSTIGLILIKDLTADYSAEAKIRDFVMLISRKYPIEFYNLIITVNTISQQFYKKHYSLLEKKQRNNIIGRIYTAREGMKYFCAMLIKEYYDELYKWKIFGYRIAHHQLGFFDPEFDDYFKPAKLMKV